MKKRLAVFASGGGTDFQSVIDGVNDGRINADIVMLIGSKQGIGAIERAAKNGIPYRVFALNDYASRDAMFAEISALLTELHVDYVVLAGYLTILPSTFVKDFPKKIINIHPSLIPAFCGDGFYGMKVHEAVIASGVKESGATVHFVDEGVDSGDIIKQVRVPVYPTDSPETLQKRVLEEEHKLLPTVIAELCK